jgi:hypothetical protein
MPLAQVTIQSSNSKGSLPGYVSEINGELQKIGIIVIQEVY